MARSKRTTKSAQGGGKLALFEVIQAAQTRGSSQLAEAVAPLVQATVARETEAEPQMPPAVPAPEPKVELPVVPIAQVIASRRRGRGREGGVSLLGFATAVAAVIAISGAGLVAFQRFSSRPPHVVTGTPPVPEVLDVGGGSGQPTHARPRSDVQTQVVAQNPVSPAAVPADFRRVNGLNYVLIQSYHSSETAHANATRDFLVSNGVGATIERGVPGWPNRLCVIGTEGFEQMKSNQKYQDYRRRLDELSRAATAADRKIKKFEPTAVQWGRS